jgi:hypothetical protein
MGTFHSDKGELHGMTVVIETTGTRVYVGRYHEESGRGVLLLDADHHDEGNDGRTNRDYLEAAFRYGVFKRQDHVLVPRAEIASVTRLGALHA